MKKSLAFILSGALCVSMLAGCGKTAEEDTTTALAYDVVAAKDYLYAMYKDKAVTTASDYSVVGIVKISGVTYDVEWTAENAGSDVTIVKEGNMTKIDVNEKASSEVNYNLKATVKAGDGSTATCSFPHSIPAYKEFGWKDYVAAADDTTVVVQGTITGVIAKSKGNSSNCLYFQDAEGGYYAYNMSQDPVTDLNLAEGMKVKITGTRSTYSGTYEITNSSVEILDTNKNVPAAVDFTDKFINAETLKDTNLTAQQGMLVTVKGVEISTESDSDLSSGYFKFKLGGKESYVRISSSVCPIVADDQAKLKAAHKEHAGYLADVTGVICVFDGAFYLTPVTADAFTNMKLAEKTDAEKVAFEADALSVATKVTADTVIELATTGATFTDATVAYTVEGDAAVLEGNKLTITVGKTDSVVKLTATVTAGSETATKEISIKVVAPADDMCQAEVLNQIANLAEGESINGTQVLAGTVTEIVTAYSEQYNNTTVNMQVAGTDTIVQVFRVVGGADIAVGDNIVVAGTIKNYKGTIEFDAKCTYSKTATVDEMKMASVAAKAFELAENEVMNGTQVLTGTVTEIVTAYSEQYNNTTVNMQITGTENTIQVFRVVGGSDIAVGDVITVTGVIKNYKGTVEFDAKCTYTKGANLAQDKYAVTIAKAYELAENEEMNGLKELCGVITEINNAYSEEYKNITVTIQVGDKTIQCYRLAGGADLAVGDTITVTGKIKNYKGTIEFDKGCTYVK